MLFSETVLNILEGFDEFLELVFPMLLEELDFFLSLLGDGLDLDKKGSTFSLSSVSRSSLRRTSFWVLRKLILFLASSAEVKSCLSRQIC